MAIFASLVTKLGFNTEALPKGANQYKQHLGKMEGDTRTFLQNMKSEFGKGSQAAQYMKLFMGGGAIAGLNFVAKGVEHFAEKIAEMSNQLRSGELSGKAFFAELVREIPVFGSVVKAVDAISEAFTGQEAIMNKVEAGWKKQIAVNKEAWSVFEQTRKGIKDMQGDSADHIKKLQDDTYLRGLEGGAKETAQIQIDQSNDIAEARKKNYQKAGYDAEKYNSVVAQLAKEENKTINYKDFNKAGQWGHTYEGDKALYDSAKQTQANKVGALKLEMKALADAKKQAEAQTEQEIIAIKENSMAKLRELDKKDADELAKDRSEQRKKEIKEAAEWELQQLEKQKNTLEDTLSQHKQSGGQSRTAQSSAIRGNSFTVLMAPTVDDPAVKETKKVVEAIKQLGKTIEDKKFAIAQQEHNAVMIAG